MIIRPVELSDSSAWEAVGRDLWPKGADHAREIVELDQGVIAASAWLYSSSICVL